MKTSSNSDPQKHVIHGDKPPKLLVSHKSNDLRQKRTDKADKFFRIRDTPPDIKGDEPVRTVL